MLLCTLICGLFFFERTESTSLKAMPPLSAILSDDEKHIVFTDEKGRPATSVDISNKKLSSDEYTLLKNGIRVQTKSELMSIAEDYMS